MRYLLVDATAIARIVRERRLQAADFLAGDRLSFLLKGNDIAQIVPGLHVVRPDNQGVLVVGAKPDRSRCLVFDLERAAPFASRTDADIVTIFQRTLRFVFKLWEAMPLSASEKVVTGKRGGRKYIVFPFPFAAATHWRMALDRVTDLADQDHFLAFRWAQDEGRGPDDDVPRGRLHLALSALRKLTDPEEAMADVSTQDDSSRPLTVIALDEIQGGRSALPYDAWMEHLTRPQAEFVERSLDNPERLEGPAGTGKTLALMLKAVHLLTAAERANQDARVIFLAHSEATRKAVEDRLVIIDHAGDFQHRSYEDSARSLEITTLHRWCADRLGATISEVEFLDRDAAESKQIQLLYVRESFEEAMREDFATHKRFLSPTFATFLHETDAWQVSEMIRHEIGVMIKGRAEEDLAQYRTLPPLRYNLPLSNDADCGFVFVIYRKYREHLLTAAQYDTDDIVLTAMAQLNTPIWRRRRETDGYDAILVDETHLFNINELSLIHFLSRDRGLPPIAFAVDRSQAIGDRGLDHGVIERALGVGEVEDSGALGTVFRSSREIVDLALSVTAGGASLFRNFADPLQAATSAFTETEERRARTPWVVECANDEELMVQAEKVAGAMAQRLPGGRAGVAVVVFDPTLMGRLSTAVKESNRPFEVIERRGDTDRVSRAQATGRFVLSPPELIGGLEFDGVVLVAVDEGRVPMKSTDGRYEAEHFARYGAHNLLYVAITRARFEVCVLVNRERGLSEILQPAMREGFLGHSR